MINDGLWDVYGQTHMGNCAELCANKYNFSRVKLVGYEEEYDYVIMTNRVNWKSLNDLKKSETCFQTFNGKVVSQVIRNGLVLSAIKEKQ